MSIVINGSGTISGISVGGLPDSIVDAGTLATNSVTAAKLEVSAITGADLPAGSVVQATQTINSTAYSTSNTGAVSTDFIHNFTPTSASNKVLVMSTIRIRKSNNSGSTSARLKLYRDGVLLDQIAQGIGYNNSTDPDDSVASFNYLDTPNTTSQVVYRWYIGVYDGGGGMTVAINPDGSNDASSITCLEIAG